MACLTVTLVVSGPGVNNSFSAGLAVGDLMEINRTGWRTVGAGLIQGKAVHPQQ